MRTARTHLAVEQRVLRNRDFPLRVELAVAGLRLGTTFLWARQLCRNKPSSERCTESVSNAPRGVRQSKGGTCPPLSLVSLGLHAARRIDKITNDS